MRRVAFITMVLLAHCYGQTRLRPEQVRNWRQIQRPLLPSRFGPQIRPARTAYRIDQLAIAPEWVADWIMMIGRDTYASFRVALSPGQPYPVLILCDRPDDSPQGSGCVGGSFWFSMDGIPKATR